MEVNDKSEMEKSNENNRIEEQNFNENIDKDAIQVQQSFNLLRYFFLFLQQSYNLLRHFVFSFF